MVMRTHHHFYTKCDLLLLKINTQTKRCTLQLQIMLNTTQSTVANKLRNRIHQSTCAKLRGFVTRA